MNAIYFGRVASLVMALHATVSMKPREGAFDHPAVAVEALVGIDVPLRNPGDNAPEATSKSAAATLIGVVGMKVRGRDA